MSAQYGADASVLSARYRCSYQRTEKSVPVKPGTTERKIVLPALRGIMGDWVYYSCLMDLTEIGSRVRFAKDIHKSTALSDMIQRQISNARGPQIARYIAKQPERFFNSLVVATYGGRPDWHALSDIRNRTESDDLGGLSEETIASIGFLTLRGDEELFALDGQHRLAGIKKAIADGLQQDPYDEVSVILVAHHDTDSGLQRTRRLFTTLNKTAKPVSKGDIIALDEDDVMAICVRRLIEETNLFRGKRLAFVANNNMPVGDLTSLTTIGNLYDVLTILFTNTSSDLKTSKLSLQQVRPDDETLERYFRYAMRYFQYLSEHFTELHDFFVARSTHSVVRRYRGNHGGSIVFRPVGLELMTLIISRLTVDMSLEQAVKIASRLPRNLDENPYLGLLWDPSTRTIVAGHKVTLREILCYMVGKNGPRYSADILVERYRRETGNDAARIPQMVV